MSDCNDEKYVKIVKMKPTEELVRMLDSECNQQHDEIQKLKQQNEKLVEFLKLVDIYEGEIIDGNRFEAEAIIELGERARDILKEIKK